MDEAPVAGGKNRAQCSHLCDWQKWRLGILQILSSSSSIEVFSSSGHFRRTKYYYDHVPPVRDDADVTSRQY